MKIIEVPPAMVMEFGEKADGSPEATKPFSFFEYLLGPVRAPQTSGFGSWDKQEIGLAILVAIKDAQKKKSHEIVLEDAQYDALLAAVKAYQWTAEAGMQTVAGGFRKALETPKKGKAGEP